MTHINDRRLRTIGRGRTLATRSASHSSAWLLLCRDETRLVCEAQYLAYPDYWLFGSLRGYMRLERAFQSAIEGRLVRPRVGVASFCSCDLLILPAAKVPRRRPVLRAFERTVKTAQGLTMQLVLYGNTPAYRYVIQNLCRMRTEEAVADSGEHMHIDDENILVGRSAAINIRSAKLSQEALEDYAIPRKEQGHAYVPKRDCIPWPVRPLEPMGISPDQPPHTKFYGKS